MDANSRAVTSNQPGMHPRLGTVVEKHLNASARAPLQNHNVAAYQLLRDVTGERNRPLILDSFCGTGHSTAALAEANPGHFVIGIDQSASRLQRHPPGPSNNYQLIQANCEALWLQMAKDGLTAEAHYLLYPNPWPKAAHLQRRIHGHPGFADLIAVGGRIELRSNWQLYVEEFGVAMALANAQGYISQLKEEDVGLTLFERKYHNSGQSLWVYRGQTRTK